MKTIFIHGGPGLNSYPERQLLKPYCDTNSMEIIFYDQLNNFSTDNPYQEIIEDIIKLISKYKDESISLIGHSSGCSLIVDTLPEIQKYIKKIVFISPILDLSASDQEILSSAKALLLHESPANASRLLQIQKDISESFNPVKIEALQLAFSSSLFQNYFINQENFQKFFSYLTDAYEFKVEDYIKIRQSMPITAKSPIFDIPLLALYGIKDPTLNIAHEKNLLNRYFPKATYRVFDNLSHFIHIDEPQMVCKLLNTFLESD